MLFIKTRALPPRRTRCVLRWIGWNGLLLSIGLALIAGVTEVWLRVTTPFMYSPIPEYFHPKVGLILKPNAEIRSTNGLDFWTISRTNNLGFLDREPPTPELAAASCHITMIGDSFVEARQVPIADKFHVRLEDLASRHLPRLNILTSAFGRRSTGQVNQLAYYDEFVRHLHPKLVVLVFVFNDFRDNSPILSSVLLRFSPGHYPFATAVRGENGVIMVRPPDADYETFRFPGSRLGPVRDGLVQKSYFFAWVQAKRSAARRIFRNNSPDSFPLSRGQITRLKLLKRSPAYAILLDGWYPTRWGEIEGTAYGKMLPPVFEDAMEITAFALDQFKARTERDGGSLVILFASKRNTLLAPLMGRLSALAEERNIPVIDPYDYIARQGAEPADTHWAHDGHWNPTGHQWAAEALLEYLEQHPEICADRRTGEVRPGMNVSMDWWTTPFINQALVRRRSPHDHRLLGNTGRDRRIDGLSE